MNTLTKTKSNFFSLLEKITETIEDNLSNSFTADAKFKIKEVALHPEDEGSETRYKKLKEYLQDNKAIGLCAGIYTLISNVTEVKALESEQADVTLQLSAYILIVSSNQIALEDRLAFNLLTRIINIINNNRWKLNYTLPASNLKRVDLYGLTVEAKQITGIKGWNPSIQAHAKDLYEDASEAHPKDLSLSLVSWDQVLRIKENSFDEDTKRLNKFIINNKVN